MDKIHQIAELNSAGVVCTTELCTELWLFSIDPDSSICIPGYKLFCKDRVTEICDGVCVYLDSKIPCKRLESCEEEDFRPDSLPRQKTSIVLCVIYHSTSKEQYDNTIVQDHVQKNLDTLLLKQPNALPKVGTLDHYTIVAILTTTPASKSVAHKVKRLRIYTRERATGVHVTIIEDYLSLRQPARSWPVSS